MDWCYFVELNTVATQASASAVGYAFLAEIGEETRPVKVAYTTVEGAETWVKCWPEQTLVASP